MSWTMIPCLPKADTETPPRWTSGCALTEGDSPGEHHTHWLDTDLGIEVVVAWHKAGERPEPNCVIRKNGH